MAFPERFSNLPAYAFPRLRALLDPYAPGAEPVNMTIGEPTHPFPDWVTDVIIQHAAGFSNYPANDGTPELQAAISGWIARRYGVALETATQVLPLNGTREGLFNACIALCPETKAGKQPVVLTPNPFYQAYAVAALAVGAEPVYVPASEATGNLPDYSSLSEDILNRTAVAYICSPANPQGAVASEDDWRDLIGLAERFDFRSSPMNAIPRSTATRRPPARWRWPPRWGPTPNGWCCSTRSRSGRTCRGCGRASRPEGRTASGA